MTEPATGFFILEPNARIKCCTRWQHASFSSERDVHHGRHHAPRAEAAGCLMNQPTCASSPGTSTGIENNVFKFGYE